MRRDHVTDCDPTWILQHTTVDNQSEEMHGAMHGEHHSCVAPMIKFHLGMYIYAIVPRFMAVFNGFIAGSGYGDELQWESCCWVQYPSRSEDNVMPQAQKNEASSGVEPLTQ
ncbi:hypothetical protein C8J56DRAFT_879780 [Mycena floridula]|nr:hypothetical protein C8J56DRAFT_879780 [Mycena floridula]